jgi:hypothetical protein
MIGTWLCPFYAGCIPYRGVVGCGASFIVMMLPPKSGRKAVRLRTARSIGALGNVYTSLMSAWITEGDAGKDVSFTANDWVKAFRGQLVAVTLQVLTGKQEMMTAAWEGNIRGRWPHAEYVRLAEIEEDMVGVLAQVRGFDEDMKLYSDSGNPSTAWRGALET